MPRRSSPDFVEALARGLDIIKAFSPTATALSVSDAGARAGLPRPTARRLLLTLEQLGYVRSTRGTYTLTSKVLELGTTYIAALGIWELARPHMQALVAQTGESSSMSQLDGSDIVYVARVPVPKIIALSVHIGTLSGRGDLDGPRPHGRARRHGAHGGAGDAVTVGIIRASHRPDAS